MSAKRISWNEFSSAMASAVICLSTRRKFNFSKYIFESLVKNVDSNSKFYMYPRFIQLIIKNQLGDLLTHTTKYTSPALTQKVFADMRRVGKGFSGVETPLFEGMLVTGVIEEEGDVVQDQSIPSPTPPTPPPQQPQDLPSTSQVQHTPPQSPQPQPQPQPQAQQQADDFPMSLLQEVLDACVALTRRVKHLEYDKVAQALEITKLKRRVKKLEKDNKVKVLKLRRLKKVGTSQRIDTSDDTVMEDAFNQGRMIDDLDSDAGVVLMDDKEEEKKAEEAKKDEPAEVQEVVDVVTIAKLITEVVTAASESVTTASTTIYAAEPQVPAATTTVVPQKAKEDPFVQRYQVMKKRPETEAQARKNMIMYLKNVAGFRLDYFKGLSYDDIPKRKKLNEEVEDLKRHLESMPDEDDDVYTEATPLARKVPVVDYEIIHLNNKPHYKIIRVNKTHQLYVSFLTLLKNFNREDLESLWSLVKERFSTSKPNNFSDDFLLTTLGAMFERPDGQAQVWKNQRTAHVQAKVKSWKLLESCGVHIITFTTT
uniref:Synaptobrevin, longin-like domain protein n=1 Tax=Tanacetum cinerariifolium TaxID=118510 RepID=A0A6L2MRL7_TANCI|nr:hypothetical protein [Tanacetum cinerariifolium]